MAASKQSQTSSSAGVSTDSPKPTEEQQKAADEAAKIEEVSLAAAPEARRLPGNPPTDGKVIKEGEKVSFEAEEIGDQMVIKENVYREFYPFNAMRPSYSILYSAGTVIPKSAVEAVKAQAEAEASTEK